MANLQENENKKFIYNLSIDFVSTENFKSIASKNIQENYTASSAQEILYSASKKHLYDFSEEIYRILKDQRKNGFPISVKIHGLKSV